MQSTENAKRVELVLPTWIVDALEAEAKSRGISLEDLIVQIVRLHLQERLAK